MRRLLFALLDTLPAKAAIGVVVIGMVVWQAVWNRRTR